MKTKKLSSCAYVSRGLLYMAVVCCTQGANVRADESQWLLSPDVSANSTSSESPNALAPASTTNSTGKHSLRTVASSLAIVLGGFLVLSLLLRQPKQATTTSRLIETLGAVHVTPKVKLHLVRFGPRILMLHLASNAVQCIAELSDPMDVQSFLNDAGNGVALSPQVEELLRASEYRSFSESAAEI